MRSLLLILALAATSRAAPPESFWRALHQVESSGRTSGLILGDQGRSRGPLQIGRAYHADSGVAGPYERVDGLAYSRRVVTAYLRRYARAAWDAGDVDTLARVHNGGPKGAQRTATLGYAARVRRAMQ